MQAKCLRAATSTRAYHFGRSADHSTLGRSRSGVCYWPKADMAGDVSTGAGVSVNRSGRSTRPESAAFQEFACNRCYSRFRGRPVLLAFLTLECRCALTAA